MIGKDTAIQTVLRKLKVLPEGHAIDLRTYKRNRSVVIAHTGKDAFEVTERGFFEDKFMTDLAGMRKLLKMLLKREFPRSTKIRLYELGPDECGTPIRRKTI